MNMTNVELAEMLREVKAERDALASHVERLRTSLKLAKDRIGLLADVATQKGAAVYAAHDIWPGEIDRALEESPDTSLARLKAEWQAEALKAQAVEVSRAYLSDEMLCAEDVHDLLISGAAELRAKPRRPHERLIHLAGDVPGPVGATPRHGALRQPDCSQTGGAVDGPAAGIDYRSEEKDMSEKWTPVPGYEICRDGTILSHATNWRGYGSRPISWADDGSGYPAVRMTEPNGRRRKFKVHQLVCRAFHGERPTASHEVRHLDGNPMNNHADNLAWGTRSENALDRSRHGTQYRPNWSDPEFRERQRQAMRDGWAKKKQRVLS